MDNIDRKRKERKSKNNSLNNVGILIAFPFLISVFIHYSISEQTIDYLRYNLNIPPLPLIGSFLSIGIGIYYRFNKEKLKNFSDKIFNLFKKKE